MDGGTSMIDIAFWGTRGSCSCSGPGVARYGGSTSCVVLTIDGQAPIVFDLGSGLRAYGEHWAAQHPGQMFCGVALLTHLHYDHIQGLPFFGPALVPGSRIDVYGPRQMHSSLDEEMHSFVSPPQFPVTLDDFHGKVTFHEVLNDTLVFDEVSVRVASVPHTGTTIGFRVEYGGRSVVYVSDHQQPQDGSLGVAESVLDLCAGADLLIHDAQYTNDEFRLRRDWGHCTIQYAVQVAHQAGVKTLALYHHDPSHDDDQLDQLLQQAQRYAATIGTVAVTMPVEGASLTL